jgi:uncharacterized protein (TIGR00725 family)
MSSAAPGPSPAVDVPLRIAVCGAGVATPAENAAAETAGRLIAEAGAILFCGGRTGVMEAAARGAAAAGGLTVGLLPGGDPGEANPYIRVPIATDLAEARNVLVVRAAEAVVAVGGEWGTLSEVAFARKIGTPVVLLLPGLTSTLGLPVAETPEAAAQMALDWARAGRRT